MSFNGGDGNGGGGGDGFVPPNVAPYYVNGWERTDHGNFYVEYSAQAEDIECRVRIATLQSVIDRNFRLMALAGNPRETPQWYDLDPAVEDEPRADLMDAARRLVDLLERVTPDEAVAQLRRSELFEGDAEYPAWTDTLPSPGSGGAGAGQGVASTPGWPREVNGWEREWADSSTARYSAVLDRSEAGGDMVGAYIALSIVQRSTASGNRYFLRWAYSVDGPMGDLTDTADSPAFDTFDDAARRFKQTLERLAPGVFLGDIREGDPPWGEVSATAGDFDSGEFPREMNGWELASVSDGLPEYRVDLDATTTVRLMVQRTTTYRQGERPEETFYLFYQHNNTPDESIQSGESETFATREEAIEFLVDILAEWTPGEFVTNATDSDPFAAFRRGAPGGRERDRGRDRGDRSGWYQSQSGHWQASVEDYRVSLFTRLDRRVLIISVRDPSYDFHTIATHTIRGSEVPLKSDGAVDFEAFTRQTTPREAYDAAMQTQPDDYDPPDRVGGDWQRRATLAPGGHPSYVGDFSEIGGIPDEFGDVVRVLATVGQNETTGEYYVTVVGQNTYRGQEFTFEKPLLSQTAEAAYRHFRDWLENNLPREVARNHVDEVDPMPHDLYGWEKDTRDGDDLDVPDEVGPIYWGRPSVIGIELIFIAMRPGESRGTAQYRPDAPASARRAPEWELIIQVRPSDSNPNEEVGEGIYPLQSTRREDALDEFRDFLRTNRPDEVAQEYRAGGGSPEVPSEIGRWRLRATEGDDTEFPIYEAHDPAPGVRLVELEFRGNLDTPTGWGSVVRIHEGEQTVSDATEVTLSLSGLDHDTAREQFVEYVRTHSPDDVIDRHGPGNGGMF